MSSVWDDSGDEEPEKTACKSSPTTRGSTAERPWSTSKLKKGSVSPPAQAASAAPPPRLNGGGGEGGGGESTRSAPPRTKSSAWDSSDEEDGDGLFGGRGGRIGGNGGNVRQRLAAFEAKIDTKMDKNKDTDKDRANATANATANTSKSSSLPAPARKAPIGGGGGGGWGGVGGAGGAEKRKANVAQPNGHGTMAAHGSSSASVNKKQQFLQIMRAVNGSSSASTHPRKEAHTEPPPTHAAPHKPRPRDVMGEAVLQAYTLNKKLSEKFFFLHVIFFCRSSRSRP